MAGLSVEIASPACEAVAIARDAAVHIDSQAVAGLPAAPGRTRQLSESAVRARNSASEMAADALQAILGQPGSLVGTLSSRDYIQLVDLAGRDWHPGKRGRISGPPPAVLGRLGIAPDRWIDHVRAVKPKAGFYRAIGSEAALIDKTAAIGQRWLRGLSIARSLQP